MVGEMYQGLVCHRRGACHEIISLSFTMRLVELCMVFGITSLHSTMKQSIMS